MPNRILLLQLALVLGVVTFGVSPGLSGSGEPSQAIGPPERATSFGLHTLRFEENHGQFLSDAAFVARGSAATLELADAAVSVRLRDHAPIRLTWPGAQASRAAGEERLAGTTNYLRSSRPSEWRTNIPSYGRVKYAGLYPGVDLVFYGNERRLEYDFVVAPGARPGAIRMAVSGADDVLVDGRGALVTTAGPERIVHEAPIAYQLDAGRRVPVSARYALAGREARFEVGPYDDSRALYIDPVLSLSTFLGGSGSDTARAVTTDADGNVYVAGYSASPDFMGGTVRATTDDDVYVAKLAPDGTPIYATFVGTANTDEKAWGIAVDASGDAYVSGETYYPGSGDPFPDVNGFSQATGGAFLFKLDPSGASLLYSTNITSGSSAVGFGVAVQGDVAFVAGMAVAGDSFPLWPQSVTGSTYQGGKLGTYQAFLLRINTAAAGTASLDYATRFGGWDWNYAYGVAVNSAGEAFVTGATSSNDFPITAGAFQPGCGSDGNCNNRVKDAFVTKFDAGGGIAYSTYVGGANEDVAYGIALDASDDAYVTGVTSSADFPVTVGALDTQCGADGACDSGGSDVFVAKLDPTGSGLVYSTYLGGSSTETGYAIAVDSAGSAYVAGATDSDDFPAVNAVFGGPAGTNRSAFLAQLDPAGASLVQSTYLGGTGNTAGGDQAYGVAALSNGAYIVGQTDSSDFPVTAGAPQPVHAGGQFDAFLSRITSSTTTGPGSGGNGCSCTTASSRSEPRAPAMLALGVLGLALGARRRWAPRRQAGSVSPSS